MARRLVEVDVRPLRRPPRHPSADDRRARHPGRAGRHRARGRRHRRARRRRRCFGALFSLPTSTGASSTGARDRHASTQPAGSPSSPPICWRACCSLRRASWAPTSPSARRSASACRWASAAPTPRSSPPTRARPGAMPGRLVGVSTDTDGPAGAAPRAADPGTAHPPREGDVEHLHGPGAARQHRRAVRRVARPRRAAPHRRACRTADADRGRLAAARPGSRPARRRCSTRSSSTASTPTRCSPPRPTASTCAASATAVGISFDETTTVDVVVEPCSRRSASTAMPARTGVPSDAPRGAARGPTSSSPSRSSSGYHTEHEMLRYLRRLADRDLALDRTMIPLGSCTMKLNATTEMAPITWPEFADLHPFAPDDDAEGYAPPDRRARGVAGRDHRLRRRQPAAQRREPGRVRRAAGDPRLPPDPRRRRAHGVPDPGQRPRHQRRQRGDGRACEVVVVATDADGNVDLDDLRAKIDGSASVGAIMVTYPSTHGVFEERIGEMCDDRARRRRPGVRRRRQPQRARRSRPAGRFGADVSHLNLHKTFCIPHGGGGPGVGPVAVRAHLAPFLPGDPLGGTDQAVGPVSAARFGSAGILPIPWVYIR